MANIKLNNNSYPIPDSVLAGPRADFVAHLGTIAGNGLKVVVGGVEYGIDSSKVAGAISDIEAVLAGTGEERLEGDGAEFHKFAPAALTFRSTAPLNELQEIQINGVTVDPSNYTLEEGSTIVTFPIDYLKTLNIGSYEVAVASDSKTVKGDFTVAAPELNEYDFYCKQPYTAYVSLFGEKESFFIRDDGTMDILGTPSGTISAATWSVSGNNITVVSEMAGTLTGTISTDGTEIYCNELATKFVLGDSSILADEEYIYTYKEELGGYEAKPIDKTKAAYAEIRTGINDIATVKIADEAFLKCLNLKDFIIPNSITAIGEGAFAVCVRLTAIAIPDSVITIGAHAFDACDKLKSIIIPDGVTVIADCTFEECFGLTNVVIPSSITSIGEYAFRSCTALTNITFNGTVAQWNAITKATNWNSSISATYVQCSDGQVAL